MTCSPPPPGQSSFRRQSGASSSRRSPASPSPPLRAASLLRSPWLPLSAAAGKPPKLTPAYRQKVDLWQQPVDPAWSAADGHLSEALTHLRRHAPAKVLLSSRGRRAHPAHA